MRRICLGLLAVWGVTLPAAAQHSEQVAIIEEPRAFGYVLGDLLVQRIGLQLEGRAFTPESLPPVEKSGNWLTRREVQVESSSDGRHWLRIVYQLINAPQQLMTISLPALRLTGTGHSGVLSVPEWPVSIAPLTPREVFHQGALQALRPDRIVPAPDPGAPWHRLQYWSLALAAVMLVWLSFEAARFLRRDQQRPFAEAARRIRLHGEDSPAAWLAMHQAFDRVAGRSVQLQNLEMLFAAAGYLQPQRAAIARFYNASNARFFAGAEPQPMGLRELCALLRQIEKRQP
ncbi:MAG: hypothetical protein JOZ93_15150 [Sinobacteraceae bacterium]|nr:hypothetical protein [Nevskiaceae bacterium]